MATFGLCPNRLELKYFHSKLSVVVFFLTLRLNSPTLHILWRLKDIIRNTFVLGKAMNYWKCYISCLQKKDCEYFKSAGW